MIVQIYEVSTPEEAKAISAIGVDHIGVLVGYGEFPRELSVGAAAKVAVGIVAPSKFQGAGEKYWPDLESRQYHSIIL